MRPWLEPIETPVPDGLFHAAGGHPLVARSLARRGLSLPEEARAFLDPDYYAPALPSELPGMEKAADRLEKAIRSGESILVWGDFDVDGQTATTMLVSALRDLGARVDYHIPVRAVESHGVNLPTLKRLLGGNDETGAGLASRNPMGEIGPRHTFKPDFGVLLTCDTGISAQEAVAYAQGRGVDVVITDHHELPPELPLAHAIVNPKMLPEGHKLRGLPGVGVAFKLAEELYIRSDRNGEIGQYYDLTALGIVADVAPVTGESRYLLQRGLAQLRTPKRVGLQAIYERAELDPTWLTEEHIGFMLAPRLNSLGRLSDANPAVELLTTQDMGKARLLALQLEGLNSRRQLLTSQVLKGALAQIEKDRSLLESPVLVLAHPAWEAGVIGIVASRLVEMFGKPAVLISISKDGIGRGSARSVEEVAGGCLVDITRAIASQANLLLGYGGHAMAAGFSIPADKIPEFRRRLTRSVERILEGRSLSVPTIFIDVFLNWGEINLDLAHDLERLAPFGPGNPALVLASRNLHLVSHSIVGREKEHLLLTVADENGLERKVIWWNGADYLESSELQEESFDLAYTLRASTFRGQRDLQLEWVDFRPMESVVIQGKPPVEVVDYRRRDREGGKSDQDIPTEGYSESNTANWKRLEKLAGEGVQVWMEGMNPRNVERDALDFRNRLELTPCKTLVIWTTPPGRAEMLKALEASQPERVVLFGIDPGGQDSQTFLERLAGMLKYAMSKHGGKMRIDIFAARLAQREITVVKGLEWLEAKGMIRIEKEDSERWNPEEELFLSMRGHHDPEKLEKVFKEIKTLLEETRAYRAWFRRAEKEGIEQALT